MIRLHGKTAGKDFTREISVSLPESESGHDVLATLWARHRIDDLMSRDWMGVQSGHPKSEVQDSVTKLGLEYNLMTQFTSFVAVEETVVSDGGRPRRVDVPVEMPHGMSYDGVFGRENRGQPSPMPMAAMHVGAGGFLPRSAMGAAVAKSVSQTDSIGQPSRKIRSASLLNQTSGKVHVKIWLNDASQETIDLLKSAGVEIVTTQQSGKLVICAMDAGKLLEVAKLASVRYIAPLS